MVLTLNISPATEAKLKARAAVAGVDLETYVVRQIELAAKRVDAFHEISGPVASHVAGMGMSEIELSDLLEEEKHAMRAEKRARQPE